MAIRLQGFAGEIPKVEPYYLPETAAAEIMDAAMLGGSLTPFRQPSAPVFTFPSDMKSIYLHGEAWLGWDHDTDVAPGPVAQDRLYITHSNGPPTIWVDGAERPLAIPNPTVAPAVALVGTLDPDQAEWVRYAYTWVTSLGEETGPSPLSADLLWSQNCTVALSGLPTVAPVADRFITGKRIYRSITSLSGATELFYVAEVPLANATFTHALDLNPLAEAIPTKEFDPPPAGLRGITSMPNGMMAAFAGKEVLFCEPYQPHAWPGAYTLTTTETIVGLAAFGTTLAVLTTGQPYIVQGMHPDQMAMQKVEQPFPCISKASIVDIGYAAVFATTDGIAQIGETGAQLMSKPLWTRDQWQAMQPATMIAARFGERYGFTHATTEPGDQHTVMIDPTGDVAGVLRVTQAPTWLYTHIESGKTYFLGADKRSVRVFDDPTATKKTFRWRSKPWRFDTPQAFGALRVEAVVETGETVFVRVYADGVLIHTITTPNANLRLPAGAWRDWQVEILGTARIVRLALARTFQELNA